MPPLNATLWAVSGAAHNATNATWLDNVVERVERVAAALDPLAVGHRVAPDLVPRELAAEAGARAQVAHEPLAQMELEVAARELVRPVVGPVVPAVEERGG